MIIVTLGVLLLAPYIVLGAASPGVVSLEQLTFDKVNVSPVRNFSQINYWLKGMGGGLGKKMFLFIAICNFRDVEQQYKNVPYRPQLFQQDIVDFEIATCTIPTLNNCNFKTNKEFLVR